MRSVGGGAWVVEAMGDGAGGGVTARFVTISLTRARCGPHHLWSVIMNREGDPMRRVCVTCVGGLALSVCMFAAAQEPIKPSVKVKKLAIATADAYVKGDYATLIDSTYPTIVKELC